MNAPRKVAIVGAGFIGLAHAMMALKSTCGVTQVVLRPRDRVTMVTAVGGLGMTLGWGLAKRGVDHWKALDNGSPV